jgi:hypothetical protein
MIWMYKAFTHGDIVALGGEINVSISISLQMQLVLKHVRWMDQNADGVKGDDRETLSTLWISLLGRYW